MRCFNKDIIIELFIKNKTGERQINVVYKTDGSLMYFVPSEATRLEVFTFVMVTRKLKIAIGLFPNFLFPIKYLFRGKLF